MNRAGKPAATFVNVDWMATESEPVAPARENSSHPIAGGLGRGPRLPNEVDGRIPHHCRVIGTAEDQAENRQEQDGRGYLPVLCSLLLAGRSWAALQMVRRVHGWNKVKIRR